MYSDTSLSDRMADKSIFSATFKKTIKMIVIDKFNSKMTYIAFYEFYKDSSHSTFQLKCCIQNVARDQKL